MDKEKQRIAIAEACGWYGIRETSHRWEVTDPPAPPMCIMGYHDKHGKQRLPNYLNDLNAMHEAEKVVQDLCPEGETLCEQYESELDHIVGSGYLIFATAAQRAEAFLKTLNLWEEE